MLCKENVEKNYADDDGCKVIRHDFLTLWGQMEGSGELKIEMGLISCERNVFIK